MLGVGFPIPHIEGELHERAEALLAHPERVRGTPAPRTEFGEEQAERDEDEEAQRIIRRHLE